MTVLTRPSRLPDATLLSPEEVVQLQREIEAGVLAGQQLRDGTRLVPASEEELAALVEIGHRARTRFICANVPLVRLVVAQYADTGGVGYRDLLQEGCLGLITAVERFDYARGCRFSTYAMFWIRAYIRAATARHGGDLNLPTSRAEAFRHAQAVEIEVTQRLGRPPTAVELSEMLGRTAAWTEQLMTYERPNSLEDFDLVSAFPDLAAAEQFDAVLADRSLVRGLLERLGDDARRVVELRFGFLTGDPVSRAETARIVGMAVSRVRRIELAAIETLRGICPQQAEALL